MSTVQKSDIQYKSWTPPWIAEKVTTCVKERKLPYFVEKFFFHTRHSLGLITWGTKSYEAWMILLNLLYLVRPKTIVEFGSGRSTSFLAEYARGFSVKMLSFEQRLYFYLRTKLSLKSAYLPHDMLRYTPIKGDWYDANKVRKYLLPLNGIDFLFYDGPTKASKGKRTSESFYDCVFPLPSEVKMILIDDVHREDGKKVAESLTQRLHLKRYDIVGIAGKTKLGILLNPHMSEKISELPRYIQNLLTPAEDTKCAV